MVSDYSVEKLFNEVAQGSKYIDIHNLKKFLMRCSFMPNDNLLIATIRRLDLDCDAQLNYLEFIDGIRPQENYLARPMRGKTP